MYNYLQRFAVGLEVMVEDQAVYDGQFIMEFNEAEYKLKAVSWCFGSGPLGISLHYTTLHYTM